MLRQAITCVVLTVACFQCNYTVVQKRDKKGILKYLSALPSHDPGRVISGQFESWGSAVRPLHDPENYLNIIQKKAGKWVGLVGAEYHNGHSYNKYFYNELDKVAAGLQELQNEGVVVFLNPFAEATANWFWWGGTDPFDFISLYRSTHDYLVTKKGLNNLIFIYEPSCTDTTALQYYPGDQYVDVIGFSLFVDYNREIDSLSIQNYQQLKKLGKPLAISQWGPRRGADQTNAGDQPPGDNLKLIKGIQKYFPEMVWWMNWNYAYSICTESNSNYNSTELLTHPWVINRDEIRVQIFSNEALPNYSSWLSEAKLPGW